MMKKLALLLAFAGLTASASMALAGGAPKQGINGSMHDINVAGGVGTYKADVFARTCAFCHTPHNALPNGLTPAPLWNHAPSTVTLDPYVWASPVNQTIGFNADPLVGPSRLCMGCHDGKTAVDSHGSAGSFNGGSTPLTAAPLDALGNPAKRYISDLTVTHPIGFKYDDAVAARNVNGNVELVTKDNGFFKDGVVAGLGANFDTHDATVRTAANLSNKKIQDTLYGGYMTCASCHDVHNTVNAAPQPGTATPYNYFIYAQEEGSAICLSCHIK